MTTITRSRGDTYKMGFIVKSNGVALNVTGCTFRLTVDPSKNPVTDVANLFSLTGQIENGPAGLISFDVSPTQADHIGHYFYDLQMVDGAGLIRTVQKGKFDFVQDITKGS